ncbi:hypothetical protein EMQ25_03270 [Arsenicitalea aurantiaca]|uniref:Uncharacterized protein n=1 Tax=Arsenicitalea aurantiaca TaxID=1783274 RepID=A0A433XLX7_9HYPH|nr:hypothetical protein [Arsenicitalea aurantiaca]RUT34988.1 hypothetical protein EMQ25_03270 [Arsenicitalea aurantiaca]
MADFIHLTGAASPGAIVVTVTASHDGPRAFIRKVEDPTDTAEESIMPSEQVPVEEALALARNKAAGMEGGAVVFVELAGDAEWDPRWGVLRR